MAKRECMGPLSLGNVHIMDVCVFLVIFVFLHFVAMTCSLVARRML